MTLLFGVSTIVRASNGVKSKDNVRGRDSSEVFCNIVVVGPAVKRPAMGVIRQAGSARQPGQMVNLYWHLASKLTDRLCPACLVTV